MMHDYLRGSRTRGGSIHTELRQDMVQSPGRPAPILLPMSRPTTVEKLAACLPVMVKAHEEGGSCGTADVCCRWCLRRILSWQICPFDTSWQFAQDRGMGLVECAGSQASRVVIAACPLGAGDA